MYDVGFAVLEVHIGPHQSGLSIDSNAHIRIPDVFDDGFPGRDGANGIRLPFQLPAGMDVSEVVAQQFAQGCPVFSIIARL